MHCSSCSNLMLILGSLTDVDGVYSTDPNKIPVAKIDKISYDEMLELSF